ncbi:hypothetical protein SAMN04489835_0376 [Mycolicibacterium rutilum]|uniref:Uncharacterized protein n=2 Tax=Mycolicibacterium rutilum TaxID=370526 RepID=A0A1H6IQE0_MYCRU|nr:hypothetical protein SAMN04489835_0376 [Mycolicibacterium rutilum]
MTATFGLGVLVTVGAPAAHASQKSECEGRGGTYSETAVTWNGKPGTTYRCCVKDTVSNTTSCTSTTVTKATQAITSAGGGGPRVPLVVADSGIAIEAAP